MEPSPTSGNQCEEPSASAKRIEQDKIKKQTTVVKPAESVGLSTLRAQLQLSLKKNNFLQGKPQNAQTTIAFLNDGPLTERYQQHQ